MTTSPGQYPDIRQMRETVGTYELDIRDVEVPLKIRIIRTGDQYFGIANLAVREKGAKDYYRDTGSYPSKEAALHGAVAGFFLHLTRGHPYGRLRTGAPDIRDPKRHQIRTFTEWQSFAMPIGDYLCLLMDYERFIEPQSPIMSLHVTCSQASTALF